MHSNPEESKFELSGLNHQYDYLLQYLAREAGENDEECIPKRVIRKIKKVFNYINSRVTNSFIYWIDEEQEVVFCGEKDEIGWFIHHFDFRE